MTELMKNAAPLCVACDAQPGTTRNENGILLCEDCEIAGYVECMGCGLPTHYDRWSERDDICERCEPPEYDDEGDHAYDCWKDNQLTQEPSHERA